MQGRVAGPPGLKRLGGNLLDSKGVTIVDLSEIYDSAERIEKVAHTLDQLLEYFQFQEDSDDLRLLIAVEEAHLWTSKDLPRDALRFLDSEIERKASVLCWSHRRPATSIRP